AAAAKKVPGVVVLGGDVHSNYVADLRVDFDDERSPVIASELCGPSITHVPGVAQARIDQAREYNPHLRYGRSDERGYVRFDVAEKVLRAGLRVVDGPADPESSVVTAARFIVEAAHPGPRAA